MASTMTETKRFGIDLSHDALRADLTAAAASLGVHVQLAERREARQNARIALERTFHVTVAGVPPIRAKMAPQGLIEGVKKVFAKEVEAGDPAFDDAVYITTDTPDEVAALIAHPRAREALRILVEKGCVVDIARGAIDVTQREAEGPSEDEHAEILALVAYVLPDR